jgi:dihydroxyacid dehydratase/phosphogluconate dehydratase
VGVFAPEGSALPDAVREAGGEPVVLPYPSTFPGEGMALCREWAADQALVHASASSPEALLLDAAEPVRNPAALAGLLLAALRLNLPTVVATPPVGPLPVALAGMGLAPLAEGPAEAAVRVARSRRPRPRTLVDGFSLANALRAGCSAGGGPEFLVHLAAISEEAGELGFGRTIRVLAPESPRFVGADPLDASTLLAALGDVLNDTATVSGQLKEALPEPPKTLPKTGGRLRFIQGRASGIEAVVGGPVGVAEFSGECRIFAMESRAVRAVERSSVGEGHLIVVPGCGPRSGPGLQRLGSLDAALRGKGVSIPVLTDGLPPEGEPVVPWVSLFTPEVSGEGVLSRLRDGDFLRVIPEQGRLRTDVGREELAGRAPRWRRSNAVGYAARYAACAKPALEGGGFEDA